MTSPQAKGRTRGRQRPGKQLGWLTCTCLLAGAALAQTEAPEPVPAVPAAESAPQNDTASYQQRVDATTQQHGKNHLSTAEAYTDLADAQRRAGKHEEAAQSYTTAVEIYRAIDGPFTPLAIPVLMSLGDNYREARDGVNAITAYNEARTVNRRVYGLLNEAQIPMLDKLSATMLDLNRPAEAEQQQLDALQIVERSWPPESDQALGAIYKYAQWLHERGLFQFERDQYDRARRVIEEHYGKNDVRLATPLLGIGNSFRAHRIPDGQGLDALETAVELLAAQPTRDPRAIATALRDLGDWQVAFNKVGYNGSEYRRAWQLLGEVPDGDRLRREWFTGPVFVLREPISLRGISDDPKAPMGHVLVRFDVDRNGQTSNVTIVESDPPGLKDEAVSTQIRRSRFRPQMVDGEIVNGEGLGLRLTFQYKTDATASNDDASKKSRRSRRKNDN
ncbi:MAG TPA: tetratricopeptide repeat protein [Gammaproteobacteria bacterium]|nr:tetratricopeptide repeat protein [Gammaproteobacteria bacterium]